jgi:hypothetical protein
MKSSDDRAFVHTLVDLSRRLGLKTVAESARRTDQACLVRADLGHDQEGGGSGVGRLVFPAAELVEPLLHLVELALEFVHLAR